MRTRQSRQAARPIRFRDVDYQIGWRPEFSIDDRGAPWCLNVAGDWYQLTFDAGDVDRAARDFLQSSIRTGARSPSLLARRKYPLLLLVDRVPVRAWTQFEPRGRGARTYVNPATGDRVATTKRDPSWFFEAPRRSATPCGSASIEQTVADVVDLARLWLRSP